MSLFVEVVTYPVIACDINTIYVRFTRDNELDLCLFYRFMYGNTHITVVMYMVSCRVLVRRWGMM